MKIFYLFVLALNCDLPGISTALVLLSHTATELESLKDQENVDKFFRDKAD